MIPWFGFGQFVKGVLGKYRVEVTEVWQDVLFMVHGLGVQSEALCKLLGNCGGCADMLCLGEESSCPDSVAFFKWFILEVSLSGDSLGVSSALSPLSASSAKAGTVQQAFIHLVSSLLVFCSALRSD